MNKPLGGFQVDHIADRDRELVAKYADFIQVTPLDADAFHGYAVTILRGHRNLDVCQVPPPEQPTEQPAQSVQYYTGNPPRPIDLPPKHSLQDLLGPLRTCRLLDNGVHVHQYGTQGETYTLLLIEPGEQRERMDE